jgi:hypothetical protein
MPETTPRAIEKHIVSGEPAEPLSGCAHSIRRKLFSTFSISNRWRQTGETGIPAHSQKENKPNVIRAHGDTRHIKEKLLMASYIQT